MRVVGSESVSINRNARDVFDYISNMENFGDWFGGVIDIASIDESDHGKVGKTYLETIRMPIVGQRKVKISVVDVDLPTRFVTEGSLSPLMPRMEITIMADGEASELNWTMFSRNKSLWFRLLLLPVVRSEVSKRAKVGLANLKNNLECKI